MTFAKGGVIDIGGARSSGNGELSVGEANGVSQVARGGVIDIGGRSLSPQGWGNLGRTSGNAELKTKRPSGGWTGVSRVAEGATTTG